MPYGQQGTPLGRLANQSAWGYLASTMVILGVAGLFDPYRIVPPTIAVGLPNWALYCWSVAVTIAGLTILTGILWGRPLVERIGHTWLATALVIWMTCISTVNFEVNRIWALVSYTMILAAVIARFRTLGKVMHIRIPPRLR